MDIRGFFHKMEPTAQTTRRVHKRLAEPSAADLEGMTPSQRAVYGQVSNGEHTLITGPAGTGKSYLVRRLYRAAQAQGLRMALTAMTGVAAYQIGGTTLHSWGGLGLGEASADTLIRKIQRNRTAREHWGTVDLLVVDEVSMMKPELLDALDAIGRHFRSPSRAFGGIQMLLVGDFYQLPPVVVRPRQRGRPVPQDQEPLFAFQAKTWQFIAKPRPLVEIVRQANPVFAECLNRVRVGDLETPLDADPSVTAASLLRSRVGAPIGTETLQPTRIYPNRANVNQLNRAYISGLCKRNGGHTFEMQLVSSSSPLTKEMQNHLMDSLPVPRWIELAEGAQVILAANLEPELGLVNGSRGVVVGWSPEGEPLVQFKGTTRAIAPHVWEMEPDSDLQCRIAQTPLLLGWAVTVHKSQGMSLDLAEVDVGDTVFEAGQAYVALSRVQSLEGLRLIAWNPYRVKAHPLVEAYFKEQNM